MSALDVPIPAELAIDGDAPLSDADLASYFVADEGGDFRALLHGDLDGADALASTAERVAQWRIESDDAAEWALRKMALARDELRTLRLQADEWAARIEHWFQQAAREHERTAGFMEERLLDYGLRRRAAGGSASLSLPSGTVKTTSSSAAVEVDDDALLARVLSEALAEPQRALDEAELARWRAWHDAWAKLVEGTDEPVELVKLTPKVYVRALRQLVHVAEQPTGQTRWVLTLSCEHELTIVTDDDASEPTRPTLGEGLTCVLCPSDPIEGDTISTCIAVEQEQLHELVVLGPDDEPVPGVSVRAASVSAKVVLS